MARKMRLSNLLTGINADIRGNPDVEITGLAYDSRRTKAGDLFFCIRGFKANGHSFAIQALTRGAAAFVVEEWLPSVGATQVRVANSRAALADISCSFYNHPTKKLKLVGVTGTNGKTTTTFLIESILRMAGLKSGLIGTVEYHVDKAVLSVRRTTPESLDLQMLFKRMVDEGVEAAVMEVSSHAIDLGRTKGCAFDTLVFTTMGRDHLDYHGSMDNYFSTKAQLFWESEAPGVINLDDQYGSRLFSEIKQRKLGFAVTQKDKADVYADSINSDISSSSFTLHSPAGTIDITLKLPGFFNIYNALAAACVGIFLEIPLSVIKAGIEKVTSVPGRFERIDEGQDFTVIVDYAHTPDALRTVINTARKLTKGNVIVVFGCGGDRDKGKRPLMGRVAAELSDFSIITSDNPRSEDPASIIKEIEMGMIGKPGIDYELIIDRKLAIKKALRKARQGDIVLIAGKGHEATQEFAGKTVQFDDREVARKLLRELRACFG
jgi:UDP-N-acetylmuramoyl-L-alanyl-D-glutamate--2,6-diaminopimelate ligase